MSLYKKWRDSAKHPINQCFTKKKKKKKERVKNISMKEFNWLFEINRKTHRGCELMAE